MRFWTSDHHVGHENIIDFAQRPFRTLTEMHEAIRQRWCETVMSDDEVWVVGDAAMGDRSKTVPFFGQLPGRKVLIPGNHDHCWPGGKKNWRAWLDLYEDAGFDVMIHAPGDVIDTTIGDERVSVCHFPPTGDSHGADRYRAWRPIDHGGVFIHGHTHSRSPVQGRYVDVGVDAWDFWPVSDVGLTDLLLGHQ